jgi:N-ethylmaleimide reductase
MLTPFRAAYKGVLVANMNYTKEEADAAIAAHQVDVVSFGKAFLANPDLPARFAKNASLNEPKPDFFYTPGAEGYTDYPTM